MSAQPQRQNNNIKYVKVHRDYLKQFNPQFRRKERLKKIIFFVVGCIVVYLICFNN